MLRRNFAFRTATATAAAAGSLSLSSFYGKNFSVSPRTWQRIVEKNKEEGFANDARFLRLAIDSGGCHGYLYKFSFEPTSALDAEEDLLIKETDVLDTAAPAEAITDSASTTGELPAPQVVVDKASLGKLENAILDYHSELKGAAFVVVGNELVDQSCACALSFSIKKKPKADADGSGGGGASRGEKSFLQGSSSSAGTAIRRKK